jgi:hypothetical protein
LNSTSPPCIYLEPGLVERVAAEAFDLDPARLTGPPLDGLELPHLRAAMTAVGAELASGGTGEPLAAESLANLLAVHLIRHVSAAWEGVVAPDRDRSFPHPEDGRAHQVSWGGPSRHFKRLVGVTPGRFRMSERSA